MFGTLASLFAAVGLALAGYAAARLFLDRMAAVGSLENYYSLGTPEVTSAPVGSNEHKIRLAFGRRAVGRERAVFWGAVSAVGVTAFILFLLFHIPLWIALGSGGLVGFLGVNGWVEGRWRRVVREIESEMPTFLRTMGSMVLVTPNVTDALDETLASLNESGPLRLWLERFVQELRMHGRKGFEEMREEAKRISPSLLLAIVEMERLWETGGVQFAEAFRQAAENQARILRARNHAQAEVDGARSTLRVILLTLGGAVYFTVRVNPAPFNTPLGRVSLLALGVLIVMGWYLLQSMMDEVMK